MAQGKRWTRDELFIAMNLYTKLAFGQFHKRNHTIQEVARLMGRTSSSLSMKLANLAALDPFHQKRGIKGLSSYSKLDQQVWQQFQEDWSTCLLESEDLLLSIQEETELDQSIFIPHTLTNDILSTEKLQVMKMRRGQNIFRNAVLLAYKNQCAITGNPIPELLIASHILPWKDYPKERLNPANGICLSRNYDVAFDRGLITFDDNYRLCLSQRIKDFLPNKIVTRDFIEYEGSYLNLPTYKFLPRQDFLAQHRQEIFR